VQADKEQAGAFARHRCSRTGVTGLRLRPAGHEKCGRREGTLDRPMLVTYKTPQTEDGRVTAVTRDTDGNLLIDLEFTLPSYFRDRIQGRGEHILFAARSRIARLGINIQPTARTVEVAGSRAYLRARVQTFVSSYGIARYLDQLFLPGLLAGRLVFCDPERRLTSEQVYEAYAEHAFQLPARFSIDSLGRVTLQTHRCVYDLAQPVELGDLISVVARHDGAVILNRMQVRRPVKHIVLKPGDGAITSCTMFLHRHFIVLDSEATSLGKHLQAIVLDPVTTRGSRVFLEFANNSATTITNPSVAATVYLADPVPVQPKTWYGTHRRAAAEAPAECERAYEEILGLYQRLGDEDLGSYLNRPVAVMRDVRETLAGAEFSAVWKGPKAPPESSIAVLAARQRAYSDVSHLEHCGTRILEKLQNKAKATVLLYYFPNLIEHLHLCTSAIRQSVRRLVFRRASFEHGPFLSAHDHGRLADYQALGVEVLWCNDLCRHVATHVYRGLRGYFCPIDKVKQFKNSLIVALYGSTKPLPPDQVEKLAGLLEQLRAFFGDNLAILTGGGPGTMQQAMDIASSLGLLVGSSFLELVDQNVNPSANFYQTFQENSRHSRQRWFEISSFQIFCIGGLGTLEEIGLTLTDMKLGVMDLRPLVFFGRRASDPYWAHLRAQLRVMVEEGRGPAWLCTHVLMTDDPAEVIAFYQQLLEVG
jgi:predicted Rossmann-fold nucleotide-binding protein